MSAGCLIPGQPALLTIPSRRFGHIAVDVAKAWRMHLVGGLTNVLSGVSSLDPRPLAAAILLTAEHRFVSTWRSASCRRVERPPSGALRLVAPRLTGREVHRGMGRGFRSKLSWLVDRCAGKPHSAESGDVRAV